MCNNELYCMSSQELDRKSILDRVINRELTQVQASKILNLSDRWLRCLLYNYKKLGPTALISQKRGKISNRAIPELLRNRIINLVKDKYSDFGPTFAAEKLKELDNISVNHETLRRWMIEYGIRKHSKRKDVTRHQSRLRRECFGELVQIDGSHHDWFEGRGLKCCLIVFIDDATSSLLYCRFEESETTQGYLRSIKDSIKVFGKPVAYYSDKHSIFRVNQSTAEHGVTQCQRVMQELDIQLICANSPQAKGKVERANKTLQDRLIKELRLRNISSIEEANKYLPDFISNYNKKFAKPPKSTQDYHRKITEDDDQLNYILSVRETRKLSKNLECSFYKNIYQIVTKSTGKRLRHSEVNFATDTEGNTKIWHDNTILKYRVIDKTQRTEINNQKTLNHKLDRQKKTNKPAPNHPWRKFSMKPRPRVDVSLIKASTSNFLQTSAN